MDEPVFAAEERVLVVDDEPGVRAVMRRLMMQAGLPPGGFGEAGSAEDALALLEREGFDLVLADFRMAGRSGVDVLAWLRRNRPATARVLMTGYQDERIAIEAINSGGVHALVQKPWDNLAVLRTLRTVMAARRRLRAASAGPAQELARALGAVRERREGAPAEQP